MGKNQKSTTMVMCLFILLLFVIQTFYISRSISKNMAQSPSYTENQVLTFKELASYLRISENELKDLIKVNKDEKAQMISSGTNAWDTYRFIPYFEIGDKTLFLKSEIDNWVQHQVLHSQK